MKRDKVHVTAGATTRKRLEVVFSQSRKCELSACTCSVSSSFSESKDLNTHAQSHTVVVVVLFASKARQVVSLVDIYSTSPLCKCHYAFVHSDIMTNKK